MLTLMATLRATHTQSVQLTIDAVRSVSPGPLSRPTPCTEWNLAELLDHMTVQNFGFAGAAAGNGADETLWTTGAHRNDPIADYLASASAVTEAFAAPEALERPLWLPELSNEQQFTGEQAITMHTVDSIIHAWDVARSVGATIDPDSDLIGFTVQIGEQIPDGDDRYQPGAHFGPRVTDASQTTSLNRMLALFGRAPDWSPA